jgi:hypothetical protein
MELLRSPFADHLSPCPCLRLRINRSQSVYPNTSHGETCSKMPTRTSFFLLGSILFFSYLTTATFDWEGYPICAQTSLENTAPESCDYGSATLTEVEEGDNCLCYDTTFLRAAAQSIWLSCGCTDLTMSAGVAYSNCLNFAGGMAMSTDEFIAAGDGGQGSCSNSGSPTSTTTSTPSQTTVIQVASSISQQSTTIVTSSTASTPSPTSPNNPSSGSNGSGGLSPGVIAAISVVSVVFTVLGAVGTVWMCCCHGRSRRNK